MIKTIIVFISCLFISLFLPFACNVSNNLDNNIASLTSLSNETIRLTADNVDSVGSNTALSDMPYYSVLSLPAPRFYLQNTQTRTARDNIVLGLYSDIEIGTDTYSNFIDTRYVDIYTTTKKNTSDYVSVLQRRSLQRSGDYYNFNDTETWNIGYTAGVGNITVNNIAVERITYCSLQFVPGYSVHNFENDFEDSKRFKYIKHYIYRSSKGITNAYEFYCDNGNDSHILNSTNKTKGATLYVALADNVPDVSVYSYESWSETLFATNVSSAFDTVFIDVWDSGYDVGYELGYDEGWDAGYIKGKVDGAIENENANNSDGSRPIIMSIVYGMSEFFNIQLLPSITVGVVLLIALSASVLGLLLKLLIGG